ncbi:hypothetical protein [Nocardia sp. NPDC003979]
MHVLSDGHTPLLTIAYRRTDPGVLTIEMTVADQARMAPMRIRFNGVTLVERHVPATVRCRCPATSESVPGGVHVRHTDRCLHGEPRRYLWQYGGALYTGSLADYAAHFETLDPEAQHQLTITGDELRTWTDTYRLHISATMAEDYSFHFRLALTDEWVDTVIDSPRR